VVLTDSRNDALTFSAQISSSPCQTKGVPRTIAGIGDRFETIWRSTHPTLAVQYFQAAVQISSIDRTGNLWLVDTIQTWSQQRDAFTPSYFT